MWISAIFVLPLLSTTNSAKSKSIFPTFNTPTNLAIGHLSNDSVVVKWDLVTPQGVSLDEVDFHILIERDGDVEEPDRRFLYRTASAPLNYTITGLKPNAEYNVKLVATHFKHRESAVVSITFSTLEEDLITPRINNILQENLHDYVIYTVIWNRYPPTRLHVGFELEICTDSCSVTLHDSCESSGNVTVKYNTDFTIRVIACYFPIVSGTIRKSSSYFRANSGMSYSERILSVSTPIELGPRKIRLDWHPPFVPEALYTYYDIVVADPILTNRRRSETFLLENLRISPRLYLTGDEYELRLINEDNPPREDPLENRHDVQLVYPDSLRLEIVHRTKSAVQFHLIFKRTPRGSNGDLDVPNRYMTLGPGMARAFGLSPYTQLVYGIRGCIQYKNRAGGRPDVRCGNYTALTARSEAEIPSKVRDLRCNVGENGKLIVSWAPPRIPRGPIDGFKLMIRETHFESVRSKDLELTPDTRFYTISDYDPEKLYKIGVAAFNLDSDDESVKLVGDWKFVDPPAKPRSLRLNILLVAVLSLFLAYVIPRRKTIMKLIGSILSLHPLKLWKCSLMIAVVHVAISYTISPAMEEWISNV